MAQKKKKKKKRGRKAAHFQDSQDVQGQSPWQQDSLFITSMKLEEGTWLWCSSHCSWHVQLQTDYIHIHTRTQCVRLEWQWWWEHPRENTAGTGAAASTRGLCCASKSRWLHNSDPRWLEGRTTRAAFFCAGGTEAFCGSVSFQYAHEPSN